VENHRAAAERERQAARDGAFARDPIRAALDLIVLAGERYRAPLPEPAGFIFHMSRSGSTALARALAAVPSNRVIAEPEPLNQLLAAREPRLDGHRSGWLRGLILALTAGGGPAQRAVLKLSSWKVS